jgi:PHP family Zn ribbon phosphoesterase
MTKPGKDPIKDHESIIVNICDVCKTRYSLAEARKKDMTCCGQRMKEIPERVSVPMGP